MTIGFFGCFFVVVDFFVWSCLLSFQPGWLMWVYIFLLWVAERFGIVFARLMACWAIFMKTRGFADLFSKDVFQVLNTLRASVRGMFFVCRT